MSLFNFHMNEGQKMLFKKIWRVFLLKREEKREEKKKPKAKQTKKRKGLWLEQTLQNHK